jgi:hypothetical protein
MLPLHAYLFDFWLIVMNRGVFCDSPLQKVFSSLGTHLTRTIRNKGYHATQNRSFQFLGYPPDTYYTEQGLSCNTE